LQLVEISLPPDPGASIIYEAISELLDVSVKELRKYERLDTTDLTPSKGLTSSFDETIKRQLAPVWHTVSPKIRQLVSDMKTLRSLAGYLLKFDAITFLRYLENLKATEGVKSAWMFHSAAHVIFEGAKSRVYKLEETAGPQDNRIDKDGTEGHNQIANNKTEIKPTLDELPKWKCLIDILLELMDDVDANQNVIVFCQDEFTCEQLHTVIKPNGPSRFMESQYIEYLADKMNKSKVSGKKRTAAGASVANMVSFSQVEEAALLREAKSLDVLKKAGSSSSESNIKGKVIMKDHDNGAKDIQDPMEAWFANHVKFVSSDSVGALTLWELLPHRIVVYDPDITVVRQIELFNAQNPSINLQVYLLRYEPSPEMDKFHALLARERNAFEELIKSKGAMAKQISKEVEPIYKPIERADNSVSANAITRKAGGRSLLDKPDKIRVIVDVREFMSPLPAVLHAQGYNVIPVTLEVGDYILSPEICVERKSIPDLRGSLASGRLFQQAEAMCKHYQIAILLIEFDGDKAFALQSPSEMGEDIQSGHIMSRLSLLCLHHPRLRLVWSRSLHATADIFRQLKSNYDEPDPVQASNVGLEAGEAADSKEPAVNNSGLEILRRLPGVTDASVRPLAREAGSLAGLAHLTLDKLIEIMGSAPYARRLYEFLHQSASM
jgi:DNA excision repair protein ERCC-4